MHNAPSSTRTPTLTPTPTPTRGPAQDVKAVTWHPSGEVLVSCSYDDAIKLWANDGDEWVCAQTLAGGGLQRRGAWQPDRGRKQC